MSLRTDIHTAIDGIAPSTFGLAQRVVESVRVGRRSRRAMFTRLRAPLSFVAAVLLMALVAGVLVGGRALQGWNNLNHSANPGKSELASLEARPLNLPALGANDTCPAIGRNHIGFDYGDGPVYLNGGPQGLNAGVQFWGVEYFTTPGLAGPILVRGRDLKVPGLTVMFTGKHAAGAAVGPDRRSELLLNPQDLRAAGQSGTFASFETVQGIASGWSGCVGLQIDGPTFSEIITATGFVGG